jgi:hypothetical protein
VSISPSTADGEYLSEAKKPHEKMKVDNPVCWQLKLHTDKRTNCLSVISVLVHLIRVEWYAQLRERRAMSVGNPTIFPQNAQIMTKGKAKGSASGGLGGGSKTKMAHIIIGNVQTSHRQRGSPTIFLTVSCADDADHVTTIQATPDPGAQVTVGGRDVMEAIGVTEEDLATSSFDLVMADHSTPLLSIGQRDIRIRYGDQDTRITVAEIQFARKSRECWCVGWIVSAWTFYIKNIRSLCLRCAQCSGVTWTSFSTDNAKGGNTHTQ